MRFVLALLLVAGAAAGQAHATVFGVKSCSSDPALCPMGGSAPPTRLFSFQEGTSSFTDIGTVLLGGANVDVDGLAFSPLHGLMGFRLQAGTSRLIRIDPTNATATAVGQVLSGVDIRGAVFDHPESLLVLDAAANALLRVDAPSGAVIGTPIPLTVGGLPHDLSDGTDIAVRPDGTYLVNDGNRIYRLDAASGALTLLHTENTAEPASGAPPFYAGLAQAGSLFAYDVNGFEDIYAYDAGFNRTTAFNNIIGTFNAGRGDLASFVAVIPEPSALALLLAGLVVVAARRGLRTVP